MVSPKFARNLEGARNYDPRVLVRGLLFTSVIAIHSACDGKRAEPNKDGVASLEKRAAALRANAPKMIELVEKGIEVMGALQEKGDTIAARNLGDELFQGLGEYQSLSPTPPGIHRLFIKLDEARSNLRPQEVVESDPSTRAATDLAFSIVEDDVNNGPLKKSIKRTILVDTVPDDHALSRLLNAQYNLAKKIVQERRQITGQVWIYVYDDRSRIDAGLGEWIGMASAMAHNHDTLPSEPLIQVRTPKKGKKPPTARENQIYEDFVELLYADDGDLPESVVEKRICRKFKISKKRLDEIYFNVRSYRNLIR